MSHLPTTSLSGVGPLHRRRFLAGTAVAAAAIPALGSRSVPAAPATAAKPAVGPADTVRVGAIGVGGRASLLLEQLPEGATIVALCDVNVPRAWAFREKKGGDWPIYVDYRRILERSDIDAVIVGTGEFQRILPCIHACQAGKDVYAEKPLSLYVSEGRALVQSARKHGRVVQVGTQQRSMEINRLACKFVRDGGLGKLLEVRAVNYSNSNPGPSPFPAAEPIPTGFDWNAWLNQAADRPYSGQWMGWMGWRDFAGGEMTNWGAHGVDQIQWALGRDDAGPVAVTPVTEGPNGQVVMTYADGLEVKFVLDKGPMGGAVFVGEKGKLEINRNKVTSNPPEIAAGILAAVDVAEEERKWSDELALWQARHHLQNWLDCIKTREKPVADVEIGHRSVTVCHLANIARAVGRPLRWDPAAERFLDDSAADSLLTRERRKGFELPEV